MAIAAESNVSAKYLATIGRMLEATNEEIGPGAKLQTMWRQLPAPSGNQPNLARQGRDSMCDYVVQLRKKIELRHPDLQVNGIRRRAQPFLMWRNHLY